jgi:hypothetical protein
LVQIFHRLVTCHPTGQKTAPFGIIHRRGQGIVENNLGFIHVYGGAAVGAGEEYLSYFGMQLTTALGTG